MEAKQRKKRDKSTDLAHAASELGRNACAPKRAWCGSRGVSWLAQAAVGARTRVARIDGHVAEGARETGLAHAREVGAHAVHTLGVVLARRAVLRAHVHVALARHALEAARALALELARRQLDTRASVVAHAP